jgi:CDP-glucose 4,6-dehydratase
LVAWLASLGARVHGYALDPAGAPNLFETARIASLLESDVRADLADRGSLDRAFSRHGPEVVFHLAAQSLVGEGYRDPMRTFATNVMGTAQVLDVARTTPAVRAVVVITTDKVYANRHGVQPFRETDPLGGDDPYSASKAAAELVTSSYRTSFFSRPGSSATRVATARAGNVIGGGDWSVDRLVPDCLRAFSRGEPVRLRQPDSIRPWQHVLDPLCGYLALAERLLSEEGARYAEAWNFGPAEESAATVSVVAHAIARLWGCSAQVIEAPDIKNPPEHALLRIDSSAARAQLGWRPRWPLEVALEKTVEWHRAWTAGIDMATYCRRQISEFEATATVAA